MSELSGWQQALLLGVTVAAAVAVIALPRDLAPLELPALSLRPERVAAQQQEDLQLAAAAPSSDAAQQLLTAYQSYGQKEAVLLHNHKLLEGQRRSLRLTYDRVRTESGTQAALALRALALSKFEAVLDGRLKGDAVTAWLGVFPNVLTEHLATRDGLELAPHFVVRTLYKSRFNRVLELPAETDLSQVERQAYFGWIGLHAYNLPLFQRREALLGYAAAGGAHALEAQGVLAFLDHDFRRAVACLERAYVQDHSLRVRNYLRGARAVAADLPQHSTTLSHEAMAAAHN